MLGGGGSHSIQEHKAQNYEQHPSVPPAIADCIIFLLVEEVWGLSHRYRTGSVALPSCANHGSCTHGHDLDRG